MKNTQKNIIRWICVNQRLYTCLNGSQLIQECRRRLFLFDELAIRPDSRSLHFLNPLALKFEDELARRPSSTLRKHNLTSLFHSKCIRQMIPIDQISHSMHCCVEPF